MLTGYQELSHHSLFNLCSRSARVLQASAQPTLEFFKRPDADLRWGVNLIILEVPGCRPRLYVGSGTS